MKLVKLTFPYPDWPLARQTPGNDCKWGDYQFIINPDPTFDLKFDYWVVFNFLLSAYEETYCRNSVILITGEPADIEPYAAGYISQFDCVITSQKKLSHRNKFYLPQGLPWFINKSFQELTALDSLNKTHTISIISSSKQRTEGHKKRLDFALKLKDYFGDQIDLYGRGIKDFKDKWDVLAPYKYSIAIENSCHHYYFTEKLTDCYLALTFPLYFGCPNIYDYFDTDSVVLIDINNFKRSIDIIEGLLKTESHYERSVDSMIDAKNRVLYHYNLFPLIINFLEGHSEEKSTQHKLRKLYNMQKSEGLLRKFLRKMKQ